MSQANERSWWGRNWKWIVPIGCVVPIGVCGGVIGLVVVLVFGALKSSEPYRAAVAKAKGSAALRAALGEPIQEGFFVTGDINLQTVNGVESGKADLSIPISGPKGSATIQVVADKAAGRWTYTTLQAVIPGQDRPIDLRQGN